MKGRTPNSNENVVPLTGTNNPDALRERGKQLAADMKPDHLTKGGSKVYERIAPHVCNPLVARLSYHNLESFVLMCEALARHETLRKYLNTPGVGETYISETRNGEQIKNRPEVAQLNETFRQFLTVARDFGLTPAAERGLRANPAQGQLDLDEDDFA
ncbi:Phage terminase, small subunit [Pseudovibrio sp. Ad46]|uniref:P27 family phage terminase small subunit n=1 Tax=Pseudovibrio sp. Ad46 TaxID=989432 RepID=UPI0007AE3B61|nr:P27 family phage terminase small subunit [Pseudovibrio sp. Ad46]KZK80073.1 Phage terminase, small subunit [Pseudovibrio sp. Ad46]